MQRLNHCNVRVINKTGDKMALTGLEIFKLLPNTNCKECGFATCLAFAMRVAAKKINAEVCPYLSEEAKEKLSDSAVQPIKLIEIKSGDKSVKVGEELVMFRHEKKFFRQTLFSICIDDSKDEKEITEKLENIKKVNFNRAGEILKFDLIAVKDKSGDKQKFCRTVHLVKNIIDFPLILISETPEIVEAGLNEIPGDKPLIYAANTKNWEEMTKLAKRYNTSLVVTAENGLKGLSELSGKIKNKGLENIVLNPKSSNSAEILADYTLIRRCALEKNYRNLGFPTLLYLGDEDSFINSVIGICKYASIIIFEDLKEWEYLSLLTLRQNIFSDPQKPLQVNWGIYKVGEPDDKSPFFVTTNFSLTYFIVSTEIEGSGFSGHLLLTDSEGLSVLTAWAAGKFSGKTVGQFVKESGIEKCISHRNIIIPGYVAAISGELEDCLPDWKVYVGPQEASDISSFLNEVWLKENKI